MPFVDDIVDLSASHIAHSDRVLTVWNAFAILLDAIEIAPITGFTGSYPRNPDPPFGSQMKKLIGLLSYLCGSLSWLAIYVLVMMELWILRRSAPSSNDLRLTVIIIAMGVAATFCIAFGAGLLLVVPANLVALGKRLMAKTADEVVEADPRAPILLLRCFDDDGVKVMSEWHLNIFDVFWLAHPFKALYWFFAGLPRTLEERIAKRLARSGPVIAVGRPGERVAPLGFARRYISHDDWKAEVEKYIKASRLAVMVLGDVRDPKEGLGWEVNKLVELDVARKFVLVIPPLGESKIRQRWVSFCRCCYGGPIGGHIQGDERFVYFSENWDPVAICHEYDFLDGRNEGMVEAYSKGLSKLFSHFPEIEYREDRRPGWLRHAIEGAILGAILPVAVIFVFALLDRKHGSASLSISNAWDSAPLMVSIIVWAVTWASWKRPILA